MKLVLPALHSCITLALCILTQSLWAAPGDPDLTFGANGVVNGTFTSVGLQTDGKVLAFSGQSVRRFLPNGSPDTTFNGGTGVVNLPFSGSAHERALAVQPDNKIIATGSMNNDFALMRLNPNGTGDDTFGPAGVRTVNVLTYTYFPPMPSPPVTLSSVDTGLGVVLLPDGTIVAVGTITTLRTGGIIENRVAAATVDASGQFLAAASQDESQNRVTVSNFNVLPDGKVFIAGHVFGIVQAIYQPATGSTTGWMSLIESVRDINYPHEIDDEAFGIAAKPDGSILLAGSAGTSGSFFAGLSSVTGWQFDTPWIFSHSFPLEKSIVLQQDGRIVLAGAELVRYLPDGFLDLSFRTLDAVSGVNTAVIQTDGRILTAGNTLRRFEGTTASATIVLEQPAGTPLNPSGPPLDFGTLSVGASGTKTFTVRNTAGTPLHLWRAVLEGPSAPELSVDTSFPLTLAPGGTTTFTLQWAPLTHGPLAATFRLINSDSAKRSFDVFLKGFALTSGPEIEVQLDHTVALTDGQPGIIRLSHFRPQAALTFTNAGAQPLTFSPMQADGAVSSFSFTSPLPASLAPVASHTLTVQYLPGDLPVSAVLHFGSNDSNESPFDISIAADPSTSSTVWRQSWFSDAPPGAASGDTQDYDLDGIPNLMEYATFSSPVHPAGLAATLVKRGTVLEYNITRPLEATTELLYELEWSDDLDAGPWKTLGTSSVVLPDDGIRQQVKFTVPAGTGSRYVRLKVTRVP